MVKCARMTLHAVAIGGLLRYSSCFGHDAIPAILQGQTYFVLGLSGRRVSERCCRSSVCAIIAMVNIVAKHFDAVAALHAPTASVLNQKFVYEFGDGPASGVGDANGSPGSEDRTVE